MLPMMRWFSAIVLVGIAVRASAGTLTVTVNASTNDGYVGRPSATSEYPPSGALVLVTNGTSVAAQRISTGTYYQVNVGEFLFDTSQLSALGATMITSATFIPQIVPGSITNTDGLSLNGEWLSPAVALSAVDWTNGTGSTAFSVTVASLSEGINSIAVAPNGINIDGYTKLRLTLSCVSGSCLNPPTGSNSVTMYAWDFSGASKVAQLSITYSTGPTPTDTPTLTPVVTETPTKTPTPVFTPTARTTMTPNSCRYVPAP